MEDLVKRLKKKYGTGCKRRETWIKCRRQLKYKYERDRCDRPVRYFIQNERDDEDITDEFSEKFNGYGVNSVDKGSVKVAGQYSSNDNTNVDAMINRKCVCATDQQKNSKKLNN